MMSAMLVKLQTSFWIVGGRSASLSPSSTWGHFFTATYLITTMWMLESRKPPRPLVRYAIVSLALVTDVSERLKGKIYTGGVLAVLLYGYKLWCLTAESISRLRNWHNKRIREMCRVTMSQSCRSPPMRP